MKIPPSKARLARDGAALVEFAMVVPVFFVVVFGMVDVGRGFMVKSILDNAARVGARTGALQGKSNSDVQAAVAATLNNQGINGTTVTVTVNGNATDVSGAITGDTVKVTVSVPAGNVSWLPGTRYLVGAIAGTYSIPHS